LRITRAQLKYHHVYANGIEFINLYYVIWRLILIRSRLSGNQLASWMCWGHRRQQILVWSVPMLLIIHVLTPTIHVLWWSIFGV